MDLPGLLQQMLVLGIILLMINAPYVDSLRCYMCNLASSNGLCNSNLAACTDPDHDACINVVEKYDSFGKKYTKGCTNYEECRRLEDLNDDRYCSKFPSKCTYCCNTNKCNAENSINADVRGNPVLLISYVTLALVTGGY